MVRWQSAVAHQLLSKDSSRQTFVAGFSQLDLFSGSSLLCTRVELLRKLPRLSKGNTCSPRISVYEYIVSSQSTAVKPACLFTFRRSSSRSCWRDDEWVSAFYESLYRDGISRPACKLYYEPHPRFQLPAYVFVRHHSVTIKSGLCDNRQWPWIGQNTTRACSSVYASYSFYSSVVGLFLSTRLNTPLLDVQTVKESRKEFTRILTTIARSYRTRCGRVTCSTFSGGQSQLLTTVSNLVVPIAIHLALLTEF